MEETQEMQHRPYKIMEGDVVSIIRQDAFKDGQQYTFYKVALHNKVDDSQTYYKSLTFPKDTDLKDGTRIKIINMAEYARHIDKFRDTFYLHINEYQVLGDAASEAIKEYKQESSINDDFLF